MTSEINKIQKKQKLKLRKNIRKRKKIVRQEQKTINMSTQ